METSSLKLTPEQKLILKARLNGVSFGEMDEEKFRYATDQIILSCSAISGAQFPESELLAKYLSDEIMELLLNWGYEDFTIEEVVTAIRMNMKSLIKNPYGEDIESVEPSWRVSVMFISRVLKNYKILRDGIDRHIERKIMGY